jgi:hypothetical protein
MTPKNDIRARILFPVIAGLGCVLLALSAVNAIAAMAHLRPHIGDIVSFTSTPDLTGEDNRRLIVHRTDQFGCVLDLSALRHTGGSLMVESQVEETDGSFRVHWAGQRTSTDNANCGAQADLILDGQELDILALSAGGYGAGTKHLPVLISQGSGV